MFGHRLVYAAALAVMLPVLAAACGSDDAAVDTLPPIATTTTSTTLPATTTTWLGVYTVQSGDTLGNIAKALGLRLADLVAYNPGINPDRIDVGQVIKVPPPTTLAPTTVPSASSTSTTGG